MQYSYYKPLELNINSADQYGKTPIEYCLEKENYDFMEALLERGAVLTSEEHGKYLIKAASVGNANIVQLLLDKGINVDFKDKYKETALFKSVRNKYWHTTEILVNNGANVNLKNFEGITPLQLAQQQKLQFILKLLENPSNKTKLNNKYIDGDNKSLLQTGSTSKSSLVSTDTSIKVLNKRILKRVVIERNGVYSCCATIS